MFRNKDFRNRNLGILIIRRMLALDLNHILFIGTLLTLFVSYTDLVLLQLTDRI